jgi:hypothetical protein
MMIGAYIENYRIKQLIWVELFRSTSITSDDSK